MANNGRERDRATMVLDDPLIRGTGSLWQDRLSRKVSIEGEPQNGVKAGDGYVFLTVRKDKQTPLAKTNGDFAPLQVDAYGNLRTFPARATMSTITSITSSATAVLILAANYNRLGVMIFNDSSAVLYVALGGAVSTSNYTVQIASGGYYEVPFNWAGEITGIWASANGSARVTELIGALASELA